MSIHCLFDWGQYIQFCPSPPPYVNPLPLWLRTWYPVLPLSSTLRKSIASLTDGKISSYVAFPQPYVNPLPLWLTTRSPVLPLSSTLCQSLPLWLRTRYWVMSLFFYFMSILCHLKCGQDIQFCPLLHLMSIHGLFYWGQNIQFCPLLHLMSIHCLFDWGQAIKVMSISSILCQSIASLIEDKISSSVPLLHLYQLIASLIEDKISSSAPLLHLMSIYCLFDWG